MKRKDFLQLSVFAAVAVNLGPLHACNPPASADAMARPMFLSRLFTAQQIEEIGKAYIQKTPAENSEDKLIKLLSGNSPIAESADEKAIHQYLDEKVKHDFETGNTVLIKGWLLSLTETRQCALFSVMES